MSTESTPGSGTPHPHGWPGRLRLALGTVRRSRGARVVRIAAAPIALAYAMLVAYPGVLFAHHVARGAFQVYSDEPIDPRMAAILDEAAARLARSPLHDPAMEHRLFICNSAIRRHILAPRSGGAYGVTHAPLVRGNTILNRVDIPSDTIFRDGVGNRRRPLSSVIAHERTHALMNRRFGTIACLRMPEWKREGYCEYVGGHPSFPVEEGKRLIREGRADGTGPSRYFRAYAMVTYLLDVEGLTIDEVAGREFDEPSLLAKVRTAIDRLRL